MDMEASYWPEWFKQREFEEIRAILKIILIYSLPDEYFVCRQLVDSLPETKPSGEKMHTLVTDILNLLSNYQDSDSFSFHDLNTEFYSATEILESMIKTN